MYIYNTGVRAFFWKIVNGENFHAKLPSDHRKFRYQLFLHIPRGEIRFCSTGFTVSLAGTRTHTVKYKFLGESTSVSLRLKCENSART